MNGPDTIANDRADAPFDVDGPAGIANVNGVPLADPALEAALLGVLIVEPDTFGRIADHVFTEDFFDPIHRRMFEALHAGYEKGFAVGMAGMVKALGGDANSVMSGGVTVSQFIAKLMAEADTKAEIEDMAVAIHECADRRANEVGTDSEILDRHAPFVSRMGLRMWRDQNAPGPQYEYLIEDLIPERQICLLMGDTQTGKSFLATHLSMCGVRGQPFFGRRVLQPFGVIWCAYEAAEGASARMRAYRKHHELGLENLPFGALARPIKLWPDPEWKNVGALIEECRQIERNEFNGVKLGMVVIDTHNAGTPGASEIDSEVISKIRDHYQKIVQELGATLLIVGHTNAAGKHRGNEQLSNNVDTIIRVSLKTKALNAREVVQLKDDDKRDIRTMRVVKQREGQNGSEHDFVLRVVEDGTKNKFGKARTSCVVATPNIADIHNGDPARDDMMTKQFGASVPKNSMMFLTCVLEATAEYGIAPPAYLGLPRSLRVADYDVVKKMMSDKMLNDGDKTEEDKKNHKNTVKSALRRCRETLLHIDVIGCNNPTNLIWWTGKPVRGLHATQPKQRDLLDIPRCGDEDAIDLGQWEP